MKKTAAILLITIQLFSLVGKFLFVELLIQQNDIEVGKQIDMGNYSNAQLIEIKVPLRLPYYSSSLKFERYYGEINLDGKYYNYVMRKVCNDTVYIICLANHAKSELNKTKAEYALNATDICGSSGGKKGIEFSLKKHGSSIDNFPQPQQFNFHPLPASISGPNNIIFSSALISFCIETTAKPPELFYRQNLPGRISLSVVTVS